MELQVLKQQELLGREITVYGTNENPLFLAKDVAEWLELTNVTDMVSRIDDDEVTKLNLGGLQGICNFLTENGLYEVLMQSRKPIAKHFKKGVKNILKEIRLNGGYITTNIEDTPDVIIARALQLAASTIDNHKQKIKHLEAINDIQSEQLSKAKPLIDLASDCYVSTETMTASIISARLGFKSANAFNKKLQELGIQYKIKGDDCWKLTSKYSCKGYTKTIPFPYPKQDGTIGTRNRMEWAEIGFIFLRGFFNHQNLN